MLGLNAGDAIVEHAGGHYNIKLSELLQDAELGPAAQATHQDLTDWFAERLVASEVVSPRRKRAIIHAAPFNDDCIAAYGFCECCTCALHVVIMTSSLSSNDIHVCSSSTFAMDLLLMCCVSTSPAAAP